MATEAHHSGQGWDLNTLRHHFMYSLDEFRSRFSELRAADDLRYQQRFDAFRSHYDNVRVSDDLRYQQRFDAQQKAVADALTAAEKAVNTALANADRAVFKAEAAAEKRFEAVNEFRSVLSNQSATLIPRTEAVTQFKSINEKIDDLKARVDRRAGGERAHTDTLSTIIAISAVVVSLIVGMFSFSASHPSQSSPQLVAPAVVPVTPAK